MPHLIPILLFVLLALIALLKARHRSGGLQAVLVATYCGVIIRSFTGGASGGVWLAQGFLLLTAIALLRPRPAPPFRSAGVTRRTYTLLMVFAAGIAVGLLRYDPSVETVKAGAFATAGGIPVRVLIAGYRAALVGSLLLAFALPMRYRVNRAVFLQCLKICWVLTLVLAVLGIVDYIGVADLSFSYRRQVGYTHVGILGFHRASYGMMLLIGMFLSFALAELAGRSLVKALVYASVPLVITAMMFSWSRSSLLAAVTASVLLVLTFGRARAFKGVLLGLIAAATMGVAMLRSPELLDRFSFLWTGGLHESAGRIAGWSNLVTWLGRRPDVVLTGVGFQNFLYFVNLSEGVVALEAAHNAFLHTLTELGIVVLGVFLLWLVAIFAWLIAWRRTAVDRADRALPGIFMALMGGLVVGCLTSETLAPAPAMVALQLHFFTILGMWISYYRFEAKGQRSKV